MQNNILFSELRVGNMQLRNRIVMAPMTRCRAIGNVPNKLMAEYYEQRATAGLIITEGTSPSVNGLGYARIPGIFSKEQIDGWKDVTSAVHKAGGQIFVQLMHTGRVSHSLNMPDGSKILAPSSLRPLGQMWTDSQQMQDFPIPKEMTQDELDQTKQDFVTAALHAIEAGFDGVELHAANGYLLEEFISPLSNIRTDQYGGSIENRCRFVLEVAAAVAEAIGIIKTAIRLSPYGTANDMPNYPEIHNTYGYLSKELNTLALAYIHLVDHSAMGAPDVPMQIKKLIRHNFKKTVILCGGYDKLRAQADIDNGLCDLVAFGRPFINNPDLVTRFQNDLLLSQDLKMELFYTASSEGYTDYPNYELAISN